jgi:transcriptional regulator with XRE-family HTH domain
MHKNDKSEILKKNIKYLIKSRGETQISLCNASGLTRSTIYNILEGRVVNAQHSTIRKISDFFGVSYVEIETLNLEQKETIESTLSPAGNRNPAAVPIISQNVLLEHIDRRIGELATTQRLTYYFGSASNLVAILLEHSIGDTNEPGDLLIIKKGHTQSDGEKLAINKSTNELIITRQAGGSTECIRIIGEIIEERVYAK